MIDFVITFDCEVKMEVQEAQKEFVQVRNVRGYSVDLEVIATYMNLGVSEAARQIARKEANRIRALIQSRKPAEVQAA